MLEFHYKSYLRFFFPLEALCLPLARDLPLKEAFASSISLFISSLFGVFLDFDFCLLPAAFLLFAMD